MGIVANKKNGDKADTAYVNIKTVVDIKSKTHKEFQRLTKIINKSK